MARIYPNVVSVEAGCAIVLHVSSATSQFRVDFYRQGATLVHVASQAFQGASNVALGSHDTDWGWPGFPFVVPANWNSGAYLALIVESNAPPQSSNIEDPANRFATALFVVRSANPGSDSCILYKLPTFTYAAYNELGDPSGSLYTGSGHKVTMLRPGNGAEADPWDSFYSDAYDGTSARQTFLHWDRKMIEWLEANNYSVDYCTDLDVHQNYGNWLSHYRLVLSVGHDEYWSAEMRDHIESFIVKGGNVAFFSGNVCWWRVHLADGDTALICDKPADQWWTQGRPENALTGVSYRNAGGDWSGMRTAVGYTVQYATHWVHAGVQRADGSLIQDGDVIGDAANDALVGYEADGAALAPAISGQPRVASGLDGTPNSFLVLGLGDVHTFDGPEAGAASTATSGIYARNGIVFTAATTDWARVLASGHPQVVQITRNVLDKLRSRAVRIHGLGDFCSKHAAVEGAKITFYVDTSKLPQQSGLTYEWTASAGTGGPNNLSTFDLVLPSPPESVTVTVTVRDGTDCPGFGTLTFVPMTFDEFRHAQLICRIREFVITSSRSRKAVEGASEGSRVFVDPLWDPIKGYVGPTFDQALARQIARGAREIVDLAERLLLREAKG